MAHQITHENDGFGGALFAALQAVGGFLGTIGSALLSSSKYSVRVQDFQALHAKSDAELAALNIRREDIVHHVFQDLYYS